jgi:hypothetical protein
MPKALLSLTTLSRKNIRHLHIKQAELRIYNRIYLAETRLVASVDGRAGYIPSMYLPASRADGIVLADVRGKRVSCLQIGAEEGSL